MLDRIVTVLAMASLTCAEQVYDASSFQVLWNVPSSECASFNVTIDPAQYGFTVNTGGKFLGDRIALLYNPGLFPQILANGTRVNGGIPPLGELRPHLEELSADLQRSIPSVNFSGLAVIDFESWTPWFVEAPKEYREAALELVRDEHPDWSEERVEEQATEDWEWWARLFLEQTLKAAKKARPEATWGYYQYPLCRNLQIANGTCDEATSERNDHLSWLFGDSNALYPSIYLFLNGFTNEDRRVVVAGRLDEAERFADDIPTLPYTWFQYHDDDSYLSDEDLLTMLGGPAARGMPGAVMWGATNNANTEAQCVRLEEYLRNHLGPLVNTLTQMTAPERRAWRPLMHTTDGSRLLKLLTTLRSRYSFDMNRFGDDVPDSVANEAEPLPDLNLLTGTDQGTTGGDRGSKLNYQQLEKLRKWQSSLDRQLWEMKRTQEKSWIAKEVAEYQ